MGGAPGSYHAEDEGRDLDSEIARLETQVALSWAQEWRLLERWGIASAPRVLELGCGPGFVTERLLAALPAAHLTAVDIDPAMVALTAARVGGAADAGRVAVIESTADALTQSDDSVDFVLARYLFQHLPEPVKAAEEAKRILAPGGRLAVIDVDAELWGLAEPVFREVMPIYAKTGRFQAQQGGNRLIGRRLWKILRSAGFANLQLEAFVYHSDAIGLPAFAPQLDPDRLLPLVTAGVVTPAEFAVVRRAYDRFLESPDAFVLMVGLAASGTKI